MASTRDGDAELPGHMLRRTVRGHWLLVTIVGVFVSFLGVGFVLTKPPAYTSSAEVLLQPLQGTPFSPGSLATPQQLTIGLETEARLVASPDVTRRMSEALGTSVGAGTPDITATVLTNSQILSISYTGQSEAQAQRGANAAAQAVLASREARARSLRSNTISGLNRQIARLQGQVSDAAKVANAASPPADAAARLQSLTDRLASLEDQLATAQALSTYPGSVVAPASLPGLTQSVKRFGVAGAALILGLALGLGVALLRTWADGRIDSRYELYVAGLPLWASLGSVVRGEDAGLVVESSGDLGLREAYRRMRTSVTANVSCPAIIALTSPTQMAAIPELSSNLAVSLQEAGYRCSIVDALVDDAGIAPIFGLVGRVGLSDVLTGHTDLRSATVSRHGVTVLTAGSDPADAVEKYSGEAFRATLRDLKASCDYVIVAVQDLSSAVGVATASTADSSILITIEQVTTHEEVMAVVERAHSQRIRFGGVVTVDQPDRRTGRASKGAPFDGRSSEHLTSEQSDAEPAAQSVETDTESTGNPGEKAPYGAMESLDKDAMMRTSV